MPREREEEGMAARTESWEVKVASVKDRERWMAFVRTVQEEFHGIDLSGDANYRQ